MRAQTLLVVAALIFNLVEAEPIGTAKCGNGTVVFIANATQGGVEYQEVRVNGASDMTKCSDKTQSDSQYELKFKPGDCNVVVKTGGMVDLQIIIAQSSNAVTIKDAINNITCNVTASGMHNVTVTLDDVTIKKAVKTVNAADPPLPPLKLVAKDMDFSEVNEVNLGDDVYICAVVTPVTRSPFKGVIGKQCSLDKVMFTNDKGCIMMDRMVKDMPTGGFKYNSSDGATCVKIQAFRGKDQLSSAKVTVECDIEFTLETSKQDDASCNITARRRRDVEDHVIRRVTLVLGLKNGDQGNDRPEQNQVEGASDRYISSTVFYVVVVILACLLIITALVAVFFARRSRRLRVTSTGKENPAF